MVQRDSVLLRPIGRAEAQAVWLLSSGFEELKREQLSDAVLALAGPIFCMRPRFDTRYPDETFHSDDTLVRRRPKVNTTTHS